MDLGLKGLNALVTGGTKGIGRRAADMFAAEGAKLILSGGLVYPEYPRPAAPAVSGR